MLGEIEFERRPTIRKGYIWGLVILVVLGISVQFAYTKYQIAKTDAVQSDSEIPASGRYQITSSDKSDPAYPRTIRFVFKTEKSGKISIRGDSTFISGNENGSKSAEPVVWAGVQIPCENNLQGTCFDITRSRLGTHVLVGFEKVQKTSGEVSYEGNGYINSQTETSPVGDNLTFVYQ